MLNRQLKNIWWIPQPPNTTKKLENNFSDELQSWLKNASMHCYGKLVEHGRPSCEKLMWIIVHITAFASLIILLDYSWEQTKEKPLTTNLHDTLYPVENVAFPALSICSNNRISRTAAVEYATHLSSLDPEKRPVSFFLNNLRNFSALYNPDVAHLKEIAEFQEFLDKFDTNSSNSHYDVRARMKLMTPPCTLLLIKCYTGGKLVPCLSPGMFQMSITHRGYCCLFNVNGTESLISYSNRSTNEYKRSSGVHAGISVLLNATTGDYFYPMFNLHGFIIHIFDSDKYDDLTSGVIAESFVPKGMESFLRVYPQAMISDDEIRSFPHSVRKCLFKDEYPEKYGTHYSLSNCITNCRIRSIARLCECLPFYMPQSNLDAGSKLPYCSLHHVSCLNKFKTKWFTVLTVREDIPELGGDSENALFCPDCLPSCSYVRYKLTLNTIPLTRYQIRESPITSDIQNMSEIALLRVYFAQPTTWMFRQSVSYPWYQAVSNIGGICGIITGFSLASLCELVYFILQQVFRSCKRLSSRTEKLKDTLIIYP